MLRRSATVLLGVVPCALLLGSLRPPDDDAARCPNPFTETAFLWHNIPNVGQVKLWFYPPQFIQTRLTQAYVLYVPSSIAPADAPDGSIWLAEGPYWARCFPSGIPFRGWVAPVPETPGNPYSGFKGTVWRVAPPTEPPRDGCGDGDDGERRDAELRAPRDSARSATLPLLFDCVPGSGGGGGAGGDGSGGGGGGGGGGGLGWVCEIAGEGVWDVYVDDEYVGTIDCTVAEESRLP